jgi:hypothetical protein
MNPLQSSFPFVLPSQVSPSSAPSPPPNGRTVRRCVACYGKAGTRCGHVTRFRNTCQNVLRGTFSIRENTKTRRTGTNIGQSLCCGNIPISIYNRFSFDYSSSLGPCRLSTTKTNSRMMRDFCTLLRGTYSCSNTITGSKETCTK